MPVFSNSRTSPPHLRNQEYRAAGFTKRWLLLLSVIGIVLLLSLMSGEWSVRTAYSALLRWTSSAAQKGKASWYGPGFHGNRTSNGEIYNQHALTAAHPTLPEGTKVRVTNLENGKSVQVRINDRGPYIKGRIIDLSRGAAKKVDLLKDGTARIKLEVISKPENGQ